MLHVMQNLAQEMADQTSDPVRKQELLIIAAKLQQSSGKMVRRTFMRHVSHFRFVQQLLQVESSGHSISPGTF